MTPTQFKKTLAGLGLSKAEEASLFKVDRISVWRWKNGKREILPTAIQLLNVIDFLSNDKKMQSSVIKLLTVVTAGNKVEGRKGR